MGCLDHPHFSILINDTSKGYFSSSRGIRQGDPLSPFLFTLVADEFSALMGKVVDRFIIKGFLEGEDGPFISHLQFADNTLCFFRCLFGSSVKA